MHLWTSATFNISLTSSPNNALNRRTAPRTRPTLLAGHGGGTRGEAVPAARHTAVQQSLARTRPAAAMQTVAITL